MIQKVVLLCGLLCMGVNAGTYLVQADLGPDRLDPLINRGVGVVAELEHSALVLATDDQLDNLASVSCRILANDPVEGDFYVVRTIDNSCDPWRYGTVLFVDDRDHVMKINPVLFEDLIGQRVHVKKLFFRPIRVHESAPIPLLPVDPTIQEIVDKVDADTILGLVQRLQDFVSRYSTYDSCFAAADWIQDKFLSYGMDSVFFQYHTGGHAPNVIAVKRGVLYPDSIYTVICGHYDAVTYYGQNIAPGADDNGSGTACAIEAARVTKDYQFEFSIRYMAFSGEEFGLYGSEYYASNASANGDSIRGVFNGDMIGYVDAQPESIEVIGRQSYPSCDWLADFFIAAADSYTTLLTRKRLTNNWIPSDNQSFIDYGYPGLLEIEDYPVTNPHYHDPSDTIGAGYNNNDFCTEVSKAQIAAIAIMAVPYITGIQEVTDKSRSLALSITPSLGRSFVIAAGIGGGEKIQLTIHDIAGRIVARYENAGTIVWHGTNDRGEYVPSGVYFVRASADRQAAQEKLILVK